MKSVPSGLIREHALMRALSVSTLVLLTLARMLRPGRTGIIELPLSAFGEWRVFSLGTGPGGLLVFNLSMLISSLILFRYLSICRGDKTVSHGRTKALLGLIGSGGYLVMICPNDIAHPAHVIGSALAVGCTRGLMIPFAMELASAGRKGDAWRMQIPLQAAVLPAAYLLGSPDHQVYQKIAIPGLTAAVLMAVRLPARQVFRTIRQARTGSGR